jgi:hypothetical protein
MTSPNHDPLPLPLSIYSRGALFPIQTPLAIYRVRESISIRFGLDFNHAGTNSAMTHALVFSVKVRRNEQ